MVQQQLGYVYDGHGLCHVPHNGCGLLAREALAGPKDESIGVGLTGEKGNETSPLKHAPLCKEFRDPEQDPELAYAHSSST